MDWMTNCDPTSQVFAARKNQRTPHLILILAWNPAWTRWQQVKLDPVSMDPKGIIVIMTSARTGDRNRSDTPCLDLSLSWAPPGPRFFASPPPSPPFRILCIHSLKGMPCHGWVVELSFTSRPKMLPSPSLCTSMVLWCNNRSWGCVTVLCHEKQLTSCGLWCEQVVYCQEFSSMWEHCWKCLR